jgi:hypothetical protein
VATVSTTSSRRDFHPQATAHAGRTKKGAGLSPAPELGLRCQSSRWNVQISFDSVTPWMRMSPSAPVYLPLPPVMA